MGITLGPSTFWCDSTIGLAYLKNTSTRYHVYVANRVSGILEHSTPEQWNHIPGKMNPDNLLTRGITASQLADVWMYGPECMKSHKSEWKFDAQQSYDVPLGDTEVKRSLYSYDCNDNPFHPIDCIINQKHWITRGRVVVKKGIHACITYKLLFGNAVQQKMADLPPERIQSGKPEFTYVGTDYFGPYHVKYRRGEMRLIFSSLPASLQEQYIQICLTQWKPTPLLIA